MSPANKLLDSQFLEMRWRVLSLAADLDRLQRQDGFAAVSGDLRLARLRQALQVLLDGQEDRAQRVQMLFSDTTPAPL